MPPCSTFHVTEPKEWFPCLIQNCPRKFRNLHGHTRHTRAMHKVDTPQNPHLQDMLGLARTPQPVIPDDLSGTYEDFPLDNFEMPRSSNFSCPTAPDPQDPAPTFGAPPTVLNNGDFDAGFSWLSSPPHSRSRSQSNESVPSTFTEYHPLINGESIKLYCICSLTYQQ